MPTHITGQIFNANLASENFQILVYSGSYLFNPVKFLLL